VSAARVTAFPACHPACCPVQPRSPLSARLRLTGGLTIARTLPRGARWRARHQPGSVPPADAAPAAADGHSLSPGNAGYARRLRWSCSSLVEAGPYAAPVLTRGPQNRRA